MSSPKPARPPTATRVVALLLAVVLISLFLFGSKEDSPGETGAPGESIR